MNDRAIAKSGPPKGAVLVIGVLLAVLAAELAVGLTNQLPRAYFHDARTYMDAASRWLAGGGFYSDYQLGGAYEIQEREVLYPPVALWLFVPFTFVQWAWIPVPVAITAWIVWSQKPTVWQWAGILAILVIPYYSTSRAAETIVGGGPTIWIVAIIALATRWPFFGPFAWLKPAPLQLPFGLVGVRQRAWWAGLGVLAALSVVFLPMWPDYARVLLNARGQGPLYGWWYVPLMFIPLVVPISAAWAARRRRRGAAVPVAVFGPAAR